MWTTRLTGPVDEQKKEYNVKRHCTLFFDVTCSMSCMIKCGAGITVRA